MPKNKKKYLQLIFSCSHIMFGYLRLMRRANNQTQRAFTLLELLLVIAVIASLAGVILSALNPAARLDQANQIRIRSRSNDLEKALHSYIIDHNGQYPSEIQEMLNKGVKTINICRYGSNCVGAELSELVDNGYIPELPINDLYDTNEKTGYDLYNAGNKISVINTNDNLSYTLKDDFLTNTSPPMISPHNAEPGPGIWQVEQLNGITYQIQNETLILGNSTTSTWNQSGFYNNSTLTVNPGNILIGKFRAPGTFGSAVLGYENGTTTFFLFPGIYPLNNPTLYLSGSVSQPLNLTISSGTWYEIGLIMLGSNRAAAVIKGGIYPEWTLAGIVPYSTPATRRPGFSQYTAQSLWIDYLHLASLDKPWKDNYGIATSINLGNVGAGTIFTHEQNFVMEAILTNLGTINSSTINFRKQDDNNLWKLNIGYDGSLILYERVAGVNTVRGSAAAGTVVNGHKLIIVADGNTIRIHTNYVTRITYSSATNFSSNTEAELSNLATGAIITDMITYPRNLTGSAAALIDKATQ